MRTEVSVEPPKDYEAMLQKLESEVRNHIRIEQQLKLHIESVQYKLEEMEKHRDILALENTELIDTLKTANVHSAELLGAKSKEIQRLSQELMIKEESIRQMQDKAKEANDYQKRIRALQKQMMNDLTRSSEMKRALPYQQAEHGSATKAYSRSPYPQRNASSSDKKIPHYSSSPLQYLHCSSGGSDSAKGLSNPYLKEVYRKHLQEKQHELAKLKAKLGRIQKQLSLKHAFSKDKLIYEPERIPGTLPTQHRRSASQSILEEGAVVIDQPEEDECVVLDEGKRPDRQDLRSSQQKIQISKLLKGGYHHHTFSIGSSFQGRTSSMMQPYKSSGYVAPRETSASKKKRNHTPLRNSSNAIGGQSQSSKKYLKRYQLSLGVVQNKVDKRAKASSHL